MADNNFFVGKWTSAAPIDVAEDAEQKVAQFFKDGSCLIPAELIGKDKDVYFYQVFENGMMKLESADLTAALYHCAVVDDKITLTDMDGAAVSFSKIREEKRSFFKAKQAEVLVPAAEKESEPMPEREPEEHEWKCPNCGKINQNYVGTCGCGEPKPHDKPYIWNEVHPELLKDEPDVIHVPSTVEAVPEKFVEVVTRVRKTLPHEWLCPKCGKVNQNYVGTCGCGEPKPHDKPYIWQDVHPELNKDAAPEEPAPEPEKKKKKAEEAPKPEKPAAPVRVPTANEWKCPQCGKINQNYVGTCGCGQGKPKA